MPNKDTPRISLGNWITGGSLIYMPPTPKKEPAKAKPAPKKVATPKPQEAKKIESPPKAPTVVSEGTDSADDVLKKAMEIVVKAEAEKQKAEEEAKKMADAEAAKKAAEEDAAKKKAEEEAAAKKKEEDEAIAKKKAAEEEAANEKALDAKIEELKAEKKRFQLEEEKKKLLHELAKDMLRGEQRALASRAVSEARFCSICGRRSHEGECDDAPNEITRSSSSNSFPVVNVNVYGGSDDAVKVSNEKDVAITTKSTDEASKTDDKHKTDTKSDAKQVENPNFTKEQDEKLLSLKADNKTWTYIGKELGINRNDCIKRHRELTGSVASKTSSSKESSLPEGHIDMGEITVMSAGIEDAFATKDDKSKDNDSEKNKKAGSNAGTNKSKGSNYKKPTVEDAGKKSDSQKKNGSRLTDNENSSSDSDNNNSYSSNATITQCQCPPPDPPYLPISFSATIPITGPRRVLVPDDTWTIKDLECLVELEFRHRKHKWMQLSADFWNITGRFIDPQIIEAKVMEAKFPEEEENADKEGEISEVSFKVKLDKTRPLDELELNISGDAWKLISEGGGGTTKIDD